MCILVMSQVASSIYKVLGRDGYDHVTHCDKHAVLWSKPVLVLAPSGVC